MGKDGYFIAAGMALQAAADFAKAGVSEKKVAAIIGHAQGLFEEEKQQRERDRRLHQDYDRLCKGRG